MTMTYAKRNDIPTPDGDIAVELGSGSLISVRCDRKRVDAGVCYHATARAIDAAGLPVCDAQGRPIATEFKHSVPMQRVDELGDDAIARECLLAVMGEPVTLFNWPASVLSAVSIRISMAAAPITGAADAGAVL